MLIQWFTQTILRHPGEARDFNLPDDAVVVGFRSVNAETGTYSHCDFYVVRSTEQVRTH